MTEVTHRDLLEYDLSIDPTAEEVLAVDETSFRVHGEKVVGGYKKRRDDFPGEWLDKVSCKYYGFTSYCRGDA